MKKRLLYAEDDDIVRGALSQLLTLLGWQVTSEPHGAAALNRLNAEEFDVVLTDHHMPVTDGLSLVQKLRAQNFPGRIYVISGALGEEQHEQYRRLNVDGIATKPVALPQLRELLGAA
jgi:CheY-like chemotaxis protein